jgi:hypothetical protein
MPKVSDLAQDQIRLGLQVKSLTRPKIGVVVGIDAQRDDYAWVLWEGSIYPYSGWYGTDCECEVVVDEHGQPIYADVPEKFKPKY